MHNKSIMAYEPSDMSLELDPQRRNFEIEAIQDAFLAEDEALEMLCCESLPSDSSSSMPSPFASDLGTFSQASACAGAIRTDPVETDSPATNPTSSTSVSPKVGLQIWQTTIGFLGRLKAQFPDVSTEDLFTKIADLSGLTPSISDPEYRQFILLMHGLRVAKTSDLEPETPPAASAQVEKPLFKRHLKARSRHYYGRSGKSRKNSRRKLNSSGKQRAKTGRKPQEHECFLCHAICPYKVDLIEHFQERHSLHRSQSLLYKRLSQGPESMLRLYNLA